MEVYFYIFIITGFVRFCAGEFKEKGGGEVKITTMIAEVYDALIEAGASEAKASAAAKSIADYENRFNEITTELKIVKTELKLIKWISGIILAAVISILVKTFIR